MKRISTAFSSVFVLLAAIIGVQPPVNGQPPATTPAPTPPKAAAVPEKKVTPPIRQRPQIPLSSFKLVLPPMIALGNYRVTTQDLRDGKLIVLDSSTKKPTKLHMDSMNAMARELVYALTDSKYYEAPEITNNVLRPVPTELTLESRFAEAERFILVPSWGRKLTIDQADYIIWFGEAMDSAIREILEPKPQNPGDKPPAVPYIMRVNAARMLSLAAKSGAPAHFATIHKLLSNPDTDPEVLIYAIKAAEGLIAAYNPILRDDAKYMIHTVKDPEMVKLVEDLQAIIERKKPYGRPVNAMAPVPPPAAPMAQPAPKANDPKAPTVPVTGQLQSEFVSQEEQLLIRYFRRAAIRALAQVRYPKFSDSEIGKTVYPLATLAKIAVGDPSITVSPGNDEVAYATMGLCNLHDYKDVNFSAVADCIAQGVMNFAGKKAGNSQDKSIPWKIIGSYLISALNDMQKVPNATSNRSKIESLATVLIERVLIPLEKIGTPGNAPNFEAVLRWRETNRPESLKLYFEANVPPIVPGFVGAQ